MALISSISGIRGTIGGPVGDNLNPLNIHDFIAAYAAFLKNKTTKGRTLGKNKLKIILGRDARISGESIKYLVIAYLLSFGVDVIDLDIISTPSLAMAVKTLKASGGIVITASHNPKSWNALKFLNESGEFLSQEDHQSLMQLLQQKNFVYAQEEDIGHYELNLTMEKDHINKILALDLVKKQAITKKKFKIVVDGINSVGSRCIPELLKSLGLKNIITINNDLSGDFAHTPEPLDKNLLSLRKKVKQERADLGIAVDPDVDRLSIIDENGQGIGEEYTLSAVADYVLSESIKNKKYLKGYKLSTVSNLSSSRSLSDLSQKYGAKYKATAVGEANVVKKMKEIRAVIGGEGNGGIIFPPLHYGRDALVGVALLLSYLAINNKTVSEIRASLPNYFIVKDKLELQVGLNLNKILTNIKKQYQNFNETKINELDGLKVDGSEYWFHLRPSNTEPIIRIYAEAKNKPKAEQIVKEIKQLILANIK